MQNGQQANRERDTSASAHENRREDNNKKNKRVKIIIQYALSMCVALIWFVPSLHRSFVVSRGSVLFVAVVVQIRFNFISYIFCRLSFFRYKIRCGRLQAHVYVHKACTRLAMQERRKKVIFWRFYGYN